MTVMVRDCEERDLAAALAIYDQLVDSTTIAWTEQPTSLPDWTARVHDLRARGFPVLVADSDGVVVGVASYGDFRDTSHWEGYRYAVEHSVHVLAGRRGEGIGRTLLDALVDRARASGVHTMVGAIDADNEASVRFHERLGFREVGRMPEIGYKFGRWLDLVLMQRIL